MARGRPANGGEPLGFEAKLWAAADKMRGHMDPAEYKHVALGLIFVKYISDAFEEKHAALVGEAEAEEAASLAAGGPGQSGIDPEDRDEYLAENVFWVPREARWEFLQASARQPEIGKLIDGAMVAIERENPGLKGVLSKNIKNADVRRVLGIGREHARPTCSVAGARMNGCSEWGRGEEPDTRVVRGWRNEGVSRLSHFS